MKDTKDLLAIGGYHQTIEDSAPEVRGVTAGGLHKIYSWMYPTDRSYRIVYLHDRQTGGYRAIGAETLLKLLACSRKIDGIVCTY